MMRKNLLVILFVGVLFLGACRGKTTELPKSDHPISGIVFVSERDGNREIYRIQPDGSGVTRLTDHPAVDSDPDWSPDGTQLVFRSRRDGSSDIFVMAADGGDPYNLIRDPSDSYDDEFSPKWNPDGSILAIFTDRFQPAMGNCEGGEGVHHLAFISLTDAEMFAKPNLIKHFDDLPGEQQTLSWSADGSMLAFNSVCSRNRQLYLWDRETHDLKILLGGDYNVSNLAFSPDGHYLAFSSTQDGASDIFTMQLESGEIRNLTHHPSIDRQPTWSPDSSHIAFVSDRDGNDEIYLMDLSGGNLQNITQHSSKDMMPTWSPVDSADSP